jgi:hypothetical protein
LGVITHAPPILVNWAWGYAEPQSPPQTHP